MNDTRSRRVRYTTYILVGVATIITVVIPMIFFISWMTYLVFNHPFSFLLRGLLMFFIYLVIVSPILALVCLLFIFKKNERIMQLIGIVVSLTYILLSAGIILFAYNIDKFEEPFKCPKDIKIEFTDDVCYDPETYSVKTTIQNKGEERVDEFSVTLQYDTTSFMDLLDESLEQEHQMKIELPSILNHGTPRTLVITPNINNEYWTACWDRQINASITLCE